MPRRRPHPDVESQYRAATVRFSVDVTGDEYQRLEAEVIRRRKAGEAVTVRAVVREAIRDYLKERG